MKIFCTLLIALLTSAMAQNPYQLKNLQATTTDVTTETNTVNAWKELYSGFKAGSLVVGADSQWAIRADNYVYWFNPATRTWDKQTQLGAGVHALAVQNLSIIYALMPASQCPGQFGMFFWTAPTWSQQVGCFTQLAAGSDASTSLLAGINNAGQLQFSTDKGRSWTSQSGSWIYVSLGVDGLGCAVDSSHNPQGIINGQAPDPLPAIPSVNGQVVGCVYATYPTTILAWTSTGYVYSMPLENFGTWQAVTGIPAQTISGAARYSVLGEDASGNIYHWNVLAPTLTATYGGQWNVSLGCPDPSHPCTSSTTHTLSHNMVFKTGHGVGGGLKQKTDLFTNDIEVANLVYNPSCDPFFGQQADQECQAEIATTAFCNESHADVQNGSTNYVVADSIDVMIFSYWIDDSGPMAVQQGPGYGYWLGNVDNAVIDGCAVSDPVPECPAESPAVIEWKAQWWGGTAYASAAWNREMNGMSASRNGLDSPYVYQSFYLAQQLPDGTLINTQCFPTPARITEFLWGSPDVPHCK